MSKVLTILGAYIQAREIMDAVDMDLTDLQIIMLVQKRVEQNEPFSMSELTRGNPQIASHAVLTRRVVHKMIPSGLLDVKYSRTDARMKYVLIGHKGEEVLRKLGEAA